MIRFRHSGRYYLRQIHKNKLTPEQVSSLLNVPVSDVDSAYEQYRIEHSIFKKPFSFSVKDTIEIIVSISSVVLVLLTLFEMRTERNTMYAPDLVLRSTSIRIAWDESGLPDIDDTFKETLSNLTASERNSINSNFNNFDLVNVGVGIAKDISITWDNKSNVKHFIDYSSSVDDLEIAYSSEIQGMVIIQSNGLSFGTGIPTTTSFDFINNSSDDSASVPFPYLYYCMVRQAIMNYSELHMIPALDFSISYSDIQGVVTTKSFRIRTDIELLMENPNGSGYCVCTLVPVRSNEINSVTQGFYSILLVTICILTIAVCIIIVIILHYPNISIYCQKPSPNPNGNNRVEAESRKDEQG